MAGSLEHLRQQLTAEDLFLVTRLEDSDGSIKLVILKDRLEIPGLICTDTQSFANSPPGTIFHRVC